MSCHSQTLCKVLSSQTEIVCIFSHRQQKYEISSAEGDLSRGAIDESKAVQEKLIDDIRVR